MVIDWKDYYKQKKRDLCPKDRNLEIFKLREQGLTLKEIGDKFGIGRERVRQICRSVGRLKREAEE